MGKINIINSLLIITAKDIAFSSALFLPTISNRKKDAITKYLYNRINNTSVTVPRNGCYTLILTLTGARIGDSILTTPSWDVPEGLSFTSYVIGDDKIKIRINNCKASDVDSGNIQFEIICIKNLEGRN